MNAQLTSLKYLKLITVKQNSTFFTGLKKARQTTNLHERLVYSFLGYRSRLNEGATVRQIALGTTLTPRTVKKVLASLDNRVRHDGKKWYANDPDPDWLTIRGKADNWYDASTYVKLLLPKKGAIIEYEQDRKRFTLNHTAVFSLIASFVEKGRSFLTSESGIGKMLNGLHRKTVASVLNDLQHLGMIDRYRVGDRLEIKLMELNKAHLEFFQPRPKAEKLKPTPPKRPADPNDYHLKGDEFDDWRMLCKGHFAQRYAEEAIALSVELMETIADFESFLHQIKERHEKNKLDGKVRKGNLGKFIVSCYKGRAEESRRQRTEAEEREERLKYLRSDECQAKLQAEREEAAANPRHRLHAFGIETITDRVRFSEDRLDDHRTATRYAERLMEHVRTPLEHAGETSLVDSRAKAREFAVKILKVALAQDHFNRHYKCDTFASPAHLTECVNSVFGNWEYPIPAFSFEMGEEVCHA